MEKDLASLSEHIRVQELFTYFLISSENVLMDL